MDRPKDNLLVVAGNPGLYVRHVKGAIIEFLEATKCGRFFDGRNFIVRSADINVLHGLYFTDYLIWEVSDDVLAQKIDQWCRLHRDTRLDDWFRAHKIEK